MDCEKHAKIFRVLSNPTRIKILAVLAEKPVCVSELMQCTCHRQAYVSQQLMFLRSIDWVSCKKEGCSVCYHLNQTPETVWVCELIEKYCPKL